MEISHWRLEIRYLEPSTITHSPSPTLRVLCLLAANSFGSSEPSTIFHSSSPTLRVLCLFAAKPGKGVPTKCTNAHEI